MIHNEQFKNLITHEHSLIRISIKTYFETHLTRD